MRFLRVADVAELLSVRHETVYRWIKDGELAAIHLGRDIRVDEGDLMAFLKSRRRKGKEK